MAKSKIGRFAGQDRAKETWDRMVGGNAYQDKGTYGASYIHRRSG